MADSTIHDLALHAAEFCKLTGFDGARLVLHHIEDDGSGFKEEAVRLVVVEEFEGDGGTCFGIGEGMVMVLEIVATTLGNDVEIVVATGPYATGLLQRAVELVVRVIHLIAAENGFQAIFVEGFVVGNERETFEAGRYPTPHFGKDVGITCVVFRQSMYLRAPEIVVFRLGFDEGIERIDHLTIAHNDDAHGADTGG